MNQMALDTSFLKWCGQAFVTQCFVKLCFISNFQIFKTQNVHKELPKKQKRAYTMKNEQCLKMNKVERYTCI